VELVAEKTVGRSSPIGQGFAIVRRRPRLGKQAQGVSGSLTDESDRGDRPVVSHDDLVAALRNVEGLHDVGNYHPSFHFRSEPFLHFHVDGDGIYADVRLGTREFQPMPASTPVERQQLLARVQRHVTRVNRTRKSRRQ
jgi:hypothetical protein